LLALSEAVGVNPMLEEPPTLVGAPPEGSEPVAPAVFVIPLEGSAAPAKALMSGCDKT